MRDESTRRGLLSALGAGAAASAGCISVPDLTGPTSDGGSVELDGVWPAFGVDARNTGHAETTGPTDPAVDWRFETTGPIFDGVAVADGSVYVGSTDGTLYAVDATSGDEQWRFPVRGQVRTTPAVAADRVFVGGAGGGLYAIDADSGRQDWEALVGVEFSGSHPTVADGTVYAGGRDGALYALEATTGERLWTADLGGSVGSSPRSPAGASTSAGRPRWKIRATPAKAV